MHEFANYIVLCVIITLGDNFNNKEVLWAMKN